MQFNNISKSYLAHFLTDLNFFGAMTVPFFIDWIRVDYTKIFLLQAWFSFWIVVLEIPTGIIADKYGRKVSVALATLCAAGSYLIYGLTREYWVLYLSEFIGAFGFTMMSGAVTALLYDSLIEMKQENDAKKYIARYEAAGTAALLVAFPVGSIIVGSNLLQYPRSLTIPFLMSAICMFLGFLVFLTIKEPPRHKQDKNFVKLGISGLKYLKNHKVLRAFATNSVIIAALTFFMFWLYQPIASNAGIDIKYFGFLAAAYNLISMILLFNIKKLEKLISMRQLLMATALVPAVLYLLLGITNNLLIVLLGIIVITNAKIIRKPILADYMNKHIESHNRATVLSSISLLERAAIFLLYPLIGLLADFNLSYTLIFLGVATLVFGIITRLEASHLNATNQTSTVK